jgi:hypothetical protein
VTPLLTVHGILAEEHVQKTAPTGFQFTKTFDAGPVHCSGVTGQPTA